MCYQVYSDIFSLEMPLFESKTDFWWEEGPDCLRTEMEKGYKILLAKLRAHKIYAKDDQNRPKMLQKQNKKIKHFFLIAQL